MPPPPTPRPRPPFKAPPPEPSPSRSPVLDNPLSVVHPALEMTTPVLMDPALQRFITESDEQWFNALGNVQSVMTADGHQWRIHMALPGMQCLVVTGLVTAVGVYPRPRPKGGFGPTRRRDAESPRPEPFARRGTGHAERTNP